MRILINRLAVLIAMAIVVNGVNARAQQDSDPSFDAMGRGPACDDMGCGNQRSRSVCASPVWTATADALFLHRSDPSSAILAFNTTNPAENLNARDLHFGVHTGFDLSLTRQLSCDNAIEIRYFGIDHWRTAASATTTPGDLFQINAAVPIFTFSGTGIDANYSSALHNAEINGRHRVNEWLDVLSGFRYAELNEHAFANLVDSAVPFNYDNATRNRLYGFQLGGQALLLGRGAFGLDAIGKAGIFNNQSAQNSTINTGLVTLPATGNGSRTAFIGELGLLGRLQVTNHLKLRGGYRLLWLDGVAQASQQLAASDFANGTGLNSSGEVFYHGAFAGLELNF
ncbi:MAG: BBP7 family outer membrane beta-barrel protein [Pirellulaceae bacterium]|nr:BBP7 family outer membrane beta-barrel protein [Pirellulaceae bacterium]